jgi:hypothetical protein
MSSLLKSKSKTISSAPAWKDEAARKATEFAGSVFFNPQTGADGKSYHVADINYVKPLEQYQGQQVADLSRNESQAGINALGNVGAYDKQFLASNAMLGDAASKGNTGFASAFGDAGKASEYAGKGANPYTDFIRFNKENINTYMNPYAETVVENTAGNIRANMLQDQLKEKQKAKFSGAFGGSGSAIANALRASEGDRQIGEATSAGMKEAYDNAVANLYKDDTRYREQSNLDREAVQKVASLFNSIAGTKGSLSSAQADMLRQIAAQQTANATAKANISNATIDQLLKTGTNARAIEQTKLDKAKEAFIEKRDYPQTVLSKYLAALGAAPTGTQQVVQGASPLSQLAGAAAAIGSVAAAPATGGLSLAGLGAS